MSRTFKDKLNKMLNNKLHKSENKCFTDEFESFEDFMEEFEAE